MQSEFVPADVVAERFERLKTVIDRSALARHQARVGRCEEVLVEGVSRRDATMLSGRTRQGKLVHFPAAGAAAGATPGAGRCAGPRHGDGGASPPPLRPSRAGHRAGPGTACASRSQALDRGRPGRRHRLGQVGRGPPSGSAARRLRDRVGRLHVRLPGHGHRDVQAGPRGTCRSAASPPGPRRSRRGLHRHAVPAGGAGRAGRHRGTRAPRTARRGHRAVPPGRRRRSDHPGALSRRGGGARGRTGRWAVRAGRPACAPGRARPGGGSTHGADQSPAGGPRPRGHARGRAVPSPSSARASRPTRTPACPRSGSPRHPRRSDAASRHASPRCSRRAWSTRCERWSPGQEGCRARRARRSATARSWRTWRTACPWTNARRRRSGAPGSSPAARPRGSAGTRASPGPAGAGEAQELLGRALAVHG